MTDQGTEALIETVREAHGTAVGAALYADSVDDDDARLAAAFAERDFAAALTALATLVEGLERGARENHEAWGEKYRVATARIASLTEERDALTALADAENDAWLERSGILLAKVASLTEALFKADDAGVQVSQRVLDLTARIASLTEALEFYADESNWGEDDWGVNRAFEGHYGDKFPSGTKPWDIARAALKGDTP